MGLDGLMWLFAGRFIAGIAVIDLLVLLDGWRHDRRERSAGAGSPPMRR